MFTTKDTKYTKNGKRQKYFFRSKLILGFLGELGVLGGSIALRSSYV